MTTQAQGVPCPCGSKPGATNLTPMYGFDPDERTSALARLEIYAQREPWVAEVEREALEVFHGPRHGDPVLCALDARVTRASRRAFQSWFFFDLRFSDDRRLAQHFLATDAPRLRPGERAYLRAVLASSMRLFEVTAIVPLVLRDVLGGATLAVSSVLPEQAREGDLMAARVLPCGRTGRPVIDGECFLIHRALREPLVGLVRQVRDAFVDARPGTVEAHFDETLPPLLHHVWLQPILHPAIPGIVAADAPDPVGARGP